jgi:HEAT repeat protein
MDRVNRLLAVLCVLAAAVAGVIWYQQGARLRPVQVAESPPSPDAWLDQLYSQNPSEAADATRRVEQLGAAALPTIHATLQDPAADAQQVKAALKACGILGPVAAPAIVEVAESLPDPSLTAEAATALSFMGRGAFAPLRDALASDDPIVRREALRAIGKLTDRAPLDRRAVLPILVKGTRDPDAGVRAVAATYLGIVQQGGGDAVSALMEALTDPEADVRRAAAAALGSLGDDAAPAVPALKKAAVDKDPDVAREAGVALVKLQPTK